MNYINFKTKEEKIIDICKNKYKFFLNKKNVVGIGLGFKITKGFNTYKKCIKVFVTCKTHKNNLSNYDLIPSNFCGIEIDVVESGIFYEHLLNKRIRPVLCGYSISPAITTSTGTLGCVVTDGENYYILSCNHILADVNKLQLGTPIIQPSTLDGGKSSKDTIASLFKFIPLQYVTLTQRPENLVDAAIARILKPTDVSKSIYYFGPPLGIVAPKLDESVRKAGRSTDITYGYITSIYTSLVVKSTRGSILYKNQILTTKMSKRGDSGSLLMNLNNMAIGLIIGGSDSDSIANPISSVLSSLNVNLVTN